MSAAKPRTRSRQSSAESRKAILAAADHLLRTRPYRELSVETVMGEAGLSRTIFYRHFDDLPSLVVSLLTGLAGGMVELSSDFAANGLAAKSGRDNPDAQVIREAFARVVGFFAEHGPLVKGVADASAEDADLEVAYEGFLRHFSRETADAIAGLVEKGHCSVPDPQATAEALTAMNERYLLRSLGRTPQEDPDTVLDTLVLIWTRTLALD